MWHESRIVWASLTRAVAERHGAIACDGVPCAAPGLRQPVSAHERGAQEERDRENRERLLGWHAIDEHCDQPHSEVSQPRAANGREDARIPGDDARDAERHEHPTEDHTDLRRPQRRGRGYSDRLEDRGTHHRADSEQGRDSGCDECGSKSPGHESPNVDGSEPTGTGMLQRTRALDTVCMSDAVTYVTSGEQNARRSLLLEEGYAMRLDGKVAVITGAGSGMGRAMANLFAIEGAKVVAAEWNQKTLDEVVAEVKAAGGEITGVQGDVSKQDDCNKIIGTATSTYGKLDVLCNNAGVMDNMAGVGNFSDDILTRVFSINVYGPMYLSRLAVPIMVAPVSYTHLRAHETR